MRNPRRSNSSGLQEHVRQQRIAHPFGPNPTRSDLLASFEALDEALHNFITTWDGAEPEASKVEITDIAYRPILHLLIRAGRRPRPR